MEDYQILFGINAGIVFFSKLILFIATLILFVKRRSVGSGLLFIAMIMEVILSVGFFIGNYVAARNSSESLIDFTALHGFVTAMVYVFFSVGFCVLVHELIKDKPL